MPAVLKPVFRPYTPADFIAVRDFLVRSYPRFSGPRNWLIDRWNFVSTVARVMNGFSVEDWSAGIGLWTAPDGEILAVANEEEGTGNVFFQFASLEVPTRELLEEMFAFAEGACVRMHDGRTGFGLRIPEGFDLIERMADERGYGRWEWRESVAERRFDSGRSVESQSVGGLDPSLPRGYRFAYGDELPPEARAAAHARAFGYAGNAFREERSRAGFAAMRSAPDYRPDLDVSVIGPDADVVAFCTVWYDETNRIAILEPVGTAPEHRRKGLARAAIDEGSVRARELGAVASFVGSDQPLYLSIGFRVVATMAIREYVKTREA